MSDTPITDRVEKDFGEMPGEMRRLERQVNKLKAALLYVRVYDNKHSGTKGWERTEEALAYKGEG
jgi:hypothetical protein